MREAMERMRESHKAELQEVRRNARDQHRLLEETITLLRDQLEALHGRS
jgi:hypothetical protein